MPLSAVIFDYGMVLSNPADPDAHHELIRIFRAPAEDFEREYWAYRHAYDEGQFDGPGYWNRCANGAGVTLSGEQIQQLIANDIRMWSSLNQTMVDWAVSVSQSGLKTGILSNIGFELADAFKELEWVKGFTYNTWSCELRLAKPDPAIYQLAAKRLQESPERLLAVEDAASGVKSARAAGMRCLGVAPAHRASLLQAAGADSVIPDFRSFSLGQLDAHIR